MSNTVRVRLTKQCDTGLGIVVRPHLKSGTAAKITQLVKGGVAEKSGLIQPGDVIMRVNDIDISKMAYQQCIDMLQSIPINSPAVLLLQAIDGEDIYLKTVFDDGGTPKTVRIHGKKSTNIDDKQLSNGVSTKYMVSPFSSHSLKRKNNKNKEIPVTLNGEIIQNENHDNIETVSSQAQKTDFPIIQQPTKTNETSQLTKTSDASQQNGRKLSGDVSSRQNRAQSPVRRRFQKLRYLLDDTKVYNDTLHNKAIQPIGSCADKKCSGSILMPNGPITPKNIRSKEEILELAKDFLDQFYDSAKRSGGPRRKSPVTPQSVSTSPSLTKEIRWQQIKDSIEQTGTYELTFAELTFGAKGAWRNASRCIGRIQWSKLQVFDARDITTARGMFDAMLNHIKYATNKGNIRSAITIFPPRMDGEHDFRVWNPQLIRYAGFKNEDGSHIGDQLAVEFTDFCIRLGWKPKRTMFEVLPLVLQANGMDPEYFEIPDDLILEVQLRHPDYPFFDDLGLKWFAIPAVSNMALDMGGLVFPGAPFNGWYMGTEIGRDICDVNRYDLTEVIGEKMGLDINRNTSLWKDRVLVEFNVAVIHSFNEDNVTIVDHHSASESFIKHMDNEQKVRGGCPADWVWIVPPLSGSICPVFHQEMFNYKLSPSYEYQNDPWVNYVPKKEREKKSGTGKGKRKIRFRDLARAVKLTAKLMTKALAKRIKCTILYATETGKSEKYAKILCELFKHAFDTRMYDMEEYDVTELEHETLVLVVTSTFGNGDAPDNGVEFAVDLLDQVPEELRMDLKSRCKDNGINDTGMIPVEKLPEGLGLHRDVLSNIRFSVFALGSSAYPHFCAFGRHVDHLFQELGADKILPIGLGDELGGEEQAFNLWATNTFKTACDVFCITDDINIQEATSTLELIDSSWAPGKFRLTPVADEKIDLCDALSRVHKRTVLSSSLISREQLQSENSPRQTILIKLNTQAHGSKLDYEPGDHLAIFPQNRVQHVEEILKRIKNTLPLDSPFQLELLKEKTSALGTVKQWTRARDFCPMTIRNALTCFLDINTTPNQNLLEQLSKLALKEREQKRLHQLATEQSEFDLWKKEKNPNLLEVLQEFPSLEISAAFLLSQLPMLQVRYYSISSALSMCPGEVHCTVAVVKYNTKSGVEHYGVASNWLNKIEPDQVVPCYIKSAPMFHLPEENKVPYIMVGPGTGIAPFRSFWQQRQIDIMQGVKLGDADIYFGCRQRALDNIYNTERDDGVNQGVLTQSYTALSREPGTPKKYVQHMLSDNSSKVYDTIVKQNGHVYVCGEILMANDVRNALVQIIRQEGEMIEREAMSYINTMKEENRYHEDIFGVQAATK